MPITRLQAFYAWPPRCELRIYDSRGTPIDSSTDRFFDLADNLMHHWPRKTRLVFFGLSTRSTRWSRWDEHSLKEIERRIKYDLEFDGYRVTIDRITDNDSEPCTSEFVWGLKIRRL